MFYFERKKNLHAAYLPYLFEVFSCRNVHFFSIVLTVGKTLANFFVKKCPILDVAGVLHPPQCAPTWIAYIFKCLRKDNNWSL